MHRIVATPFIKSKYFYVITLSYFAINQYPDVLSRLFFCLWILSYQEILRQIADHQQLQQMELKYDALI